MEWWIWIARWFLFCIRYSILYGSLELVEVVLVQCDLVDNQYQQPEVLYTFTPNKSFAYLLNAEPSSLVFLKTYNKNLQLLLYDIRKFMDVVERWNKW